MQVRDCLWVFGHEAGSHNGIYGLASHSRITPAEAAYYLNVPNLIMVRYRDRQYSAPLHQYALALRPLNRVVWSIVGASGVTDAREREEVLDLATRCPNITGIFMDDFFGDSEEGVPAALSLSELTEVRQRLESAQPRLDLWVVVYSHLLSPSMRPYLDLCDKVTFWTWKAADLPHLEQDFQSLEELIPNHSKLLGCYLWDYGESQPMPLAQLQQQCEMGLRLLREQRIEGMIFLASCICDLELESVEWVREWIAKVGDLGLNGTPEIPLPCHSSADKAVG